ncbi:MAG: tetratricopeptide repeat protein, partial [Syntrophales bacterium]|nr:tetratricopeptide repeat protein [Syntrophales bacterium]
ACIFVLICLSATGWYFYRQNEESTAIALYNKATENYFMGRSSGKDLASLVKPFEDVVKKYSGTQASAFSYYRMGNIYLNYNDIEAAIKAYQDFLKDNSTDNEFRVLVYNGLGYCYEAKKDYKNALNYFEKAMNSKAGTSFESTTLENVARSYEALNDKQKALEYYKKAIDKATEPAMKELLNRKISALG